MSQRSRGFTLLELLVVLVLMALITGLAVPLIASGTPGAQLKASARDLLAGLRQAHDQAILTREDTALTVDLRTRTFTVTGDPRAHALAPKAQIGLYVAGAQPGSDTGSFRFYPDGSSTGGRITLAQDGQTYQIDVDWLTGMARLKD